MGPPGAPCRWVPVSPVGSRGHVSGGGGRQRWDSGSSAVLRCSTRCGRGSRGCDAERGRAGRCEPEDGSPVRGRSRGCRVVAVRARELLAGEVHRPGRGSGMRRGLVSDRAGMRVHGTTAAWPAEAFAELEADCLLPVPEPYDVPVFNRGQGASRLPRRGRPRVVLGARALPGPPAGQTVHPTPRSFPVVVFMIQVSRFRAASRAGWPISGRIRVAGGPKQGRRVRPLWHEVEEPYVARTVTCITLRLAGGLA